MAGLIVDSEASDLPKM